MDPPPLTTAAADTWDRDQPLPPVPGPKMRLMCSYGGHIIPRPHDKSLCYVGGDTRMVVVDRQSSLSDLCSRLSRTLFHGHHFTIKYQLPNEDLDSLVSVTTDEDLENMIEEYDRTNGGGKLSRLRLFLFLSEPETATSMGSLLDDAKSETWFVDALNSAAFLPRVLSDSAATDQLLELEPVANVETNSSFGSGSSSSMANLPPIRVRVDEGGNLQGQMVGLDEQLSQMSVVNGEQKQDEGIVMLSAPPPLPIHLAATVNRVGSNENMGRVFSDDERSDQGAPNGFRKPPLPLLPVQRKITHDAYNLPSPDSKQSGGNNLPSPDSVASDTSITSANSLSKHSHYQDTTPNSTRPPASLISPTNTNNSDPTSQIQDPSLYIQPPQQHYFHTSNTPYLHHPSTPQVPISSYYQMYAPPRQQYQQVDQQQYKMYRMPVTQQAQPYNMNNIQQSNPADSQPVNPQINPIYQTNQPGPTMVPISNQFQQQYVNIPHQMAHLPQSGGGGNYGYEYSQPTSEQVYYGQHLVAPVAPQYQTMNPATAVLLSQASAQQHVDNSNQQM